MTDVNSEIRSAELEIRSLLENDPGSALLHLTEAYHSRSKDQREVFALAAIGQLVSIKARQRFSPT